MILTRNKHWTLFFLISLVSLAAYAQDPITIENFENYTAGAGLCTQAPAYWFTWNNGPGTSEDPKVSDSLAFDGNNSLLVNGSNDILLNLNGKTEGRYEIAFYVLVPAGKTGFYGLLQDFSGTESSWGVQCYFDANNQGFIKSEGTSTDFNFNHDQWIPVKNIVDLDNDHAEIYINNTLLVEWQWTKGLNGTSGIQQLDALNFFAWNADQRQPMMFVDSISFKQIPAPGPPLNLVASVTGNDVTLSWNTPANGTPSGYKVYRDNEVIAAGFTGLTYLDADVYPGEYAYSVKAIYGTGLSQPAGPVNATVEGGTVRKNVLLEIATGTWCTYCPGSALGADDLLAEGDKVAVIEYHDNDPYANSDATHRNAYYNIIGYPTAQFDGRNTISGGNMTQSMYPQYLPVYTKSISKLSLFGLNMQVEKSADRQYQVSIAAKKIYPYSNNNIRLQLVLTETHIPENWQTFMTEVNSVCRKMYPDYSGTVADFSSDSVLNFNYTVEIDSSYDFNNCALVAFLQDNNTKEVLQAENLNFKSLGFQEMQQISLFLYPNPASDKLILKCDSPVKSVKIIDMNGQTLTLVTGNKSEFDVSHLKPGLYLLSIETEKGTVIKKFSISR